MSCCFLALEAGFLGSMRNIRASGLCLGSDATHTKEKNNLAFSVKGGVAEHFRHMI